jgi:DNA polymerase-3 subunit epsilon
MTWADGLLVPFDLESTGVDVETDRIVTATVIQVKGADVAPRQWLAAVEIDIPPGAQAVHGVTTQRAREEGRPPAEVIAEIGDALRDGWAAGGIVVGHNVSFDMTLLDRETRRHCGRPFQVVGPIADSFVLDKHYDRYRRGKRNLTATAEHYQVALDGAHDAVEDALASARICWRMCRVYPQLAAISWRDLYRLQVRLRAEQAAGLQDHLRRKARDDGADVAAVEAITVDPFWPIKPLPTTAAATQPEGTHP